MRHYSNIFKIVIPALVLLTYIPFVYVPQAQAATTDNSQVFTKCMERGSLVALGRKGIQAGIIAATAAIASVTAGTKATASAALAVPTANPTGSATAGLGVGTATASALWNNDIKPYFDQLGYITGQCVLEQLTSNTISWIKGGFRGNPSFAIKPDQLFLDIQDSIANQMAKQVIDVQLTDFIPGFSNNLTKSIQLSTRVNARGKFSSSIRATFPPNVQPQRFYQDFRQGGWGAFGASLETNNNPFGVMILVGDELSVRQAEARATQEQKLNWSNGYIDVVDTNRCEYPVEGEVEGGLYLDANGQPDPAEYTPSEIVTIQKQYCITTTPGNVISNQLTKTLGLDMDRLGFADNMDKIITALISKLVQDTVRGVF